jgi:glutamate-1-semialdehyde 2,1-aminomutase
MVKKDINKKHLRYAKKHILNTNMLLSKNPDIILPELWPTYYSKSKNTYVWDLNNKKYLDMTCLVGQSPLGYSNKRFHDYLKKIVDNGNMTTLNCSEEVLLTKQLLKIHPWANQAKYTRSGGEANAMAIRIARAYASSDNIAICGYHGWHDWYLATNLNNKNNLSSHLFKNIQALGVPKKLKNTTFNFDYGDFENLKSLHKKFKLGVVKMEVCRNSLPDIKFLRKVRDFTKKNNIILIFDECTTGFRYNFGGVHLTTGINPDIVIYGKALGNGFAINAILGSKKVMNSAKKSFISSTFWTERLGYAAALKNLEIMFKNKTWNLLNKNGNYLRSQIIKIFKKENIKLKINSFPPIVVFSPIKDSDLFKNFLSKEMLKSNILATNTIYLNIHHTKILAENYIKKLHIILKRFNKLDKKKSYKWKSKNFYINRTND